MTFEEALDILRKIIYIAIFVFLIIYLISCSPVHPTINLQCQAPKIYTESFKVCMEQNTHYQKEKFECEKDNIWWREQNQTLINKINPIPSSGD